MQLVPSVVLDVLLGTVFVVDLSSCLYAIWAAECAVCGYYPLA